MPAAFLYSLGNHLKWWALAIIPGRHPHAPLRLRRWLFLVVLYPLFLLLQLVHWLGFLLDELFFPGYRRQVVRAPVFITGVPRSGTTFVHRTLSADADRYVTVSTWEAVLAPSVIERKCWRALAALDRAMGSPLKRGLRAATRGMGGGFDAVHEIDLASPEEDYLWLLPAGGCFILFLAFPYAGTLESLADLDRMPAKHRERILDLYHRCLQKHLYAHGGDRRLLSKNAAFGSWAPALRARYPDARFLICVREPVTALSSQLSSLKPARVLFGTDPDGRYTTEAFTRIYARTYATLAGFLKSTPRETAVCLDQADLGRDPAGVIRAAIRALNGEPGPVLDARLSALRPHPGSGHRHAPEDFPLNFQEIEDCLRPPYALILQSGNRTFPSDHEHGIHPERG